MAEHLSLTFTGLHGVEIGADREIDFGDGFHLFAKAPALMEVLKDSFWLSRAESASAAQIDCFFCLKSLVPLPLDREEVRFQNGLMALQVTKPIWTLGCIFQGAAFGDERPVVNHVQRRPEMFAGEWAQLRSFDLELINRSKAIMPGLLARMETGSAEEKNSVILFQLALEHFHPLVKGLLAVMGLEALFDSRSRYDFEEKLCQRLGDSTPVFPDWNSPGVPPPKYTVRDVALHLYTLRSKIAHGVDLRKAAQDKNVPVELTKMVELVDQLQPRPYSTLLAEAGIYLLSMVLQKELARARFS